MMTNEEREERLWKMVDVLEQAQRLQGKPEQARILYETNAGLARAAGLEEQAAQTVRDLELLGGDAPAFEVEVVVRRSR